MGYINEFCERGEENSIVMMWRIVYEEKYLNRSFYRLYCDIKGKEKFEVYRWERWLLDVLVLKENM